MRHAKKHAMRTKRLRGYFTPRLYRTLTMPNGDVIPFAINRRGCTSKWSNADDVALAEIVKALAEMHRASLSPSPPPQP